MQQVKPQRHRVRRLSQSGDPVDSSQSLIANVSTADHLRQVIADGTQFIQVVAHLDLRDIDSSSRSHALSSQLQADVRAIRGSCPTPPSKEFLTESNITQPLDIKPGQCMLVSHSALLSGLYSEMLFEGFFVLVLASNSKKVLHRPLLMFQSSDVRISNVTFHGGDIETCGDPRCVVGVDDSNLIIDGSAFVSFGYMGVLVYVGPDSVGSVLYSDFSKNDLNKELAARAAPYFVATTKYCDSSSPGNISLSIHGCEFDGIDGAPGIAVFMTNTTQYQLYVDNPEAVDACEVEVVNGECGEVCLPFKPTIHANDSPFIRIPEEPWISLLQAWDRSRSMSIGSATDDIYFEALSTSTSAKKSGIHTVAAQVAIAVAAGMALVLLLVLVFVGRRHLRKRRRLRQPAARDAAQRSDGHNFEVARTNDSGDDVTVQRRSANDCTTDHTESTSDELPTTSSESNSGGVFPDQTVQHDSANAYAQEASKEIQERERSLNTEPRSRRQEHVTRYSHHVAEVSTEILRHEEAGQSRRDDQGMAQLAPRTETDSRQHNHQCLHDLGRATSNRMSVEEGSLHQPMAKVSAVAEGCHDSEHSAQQTMTAFVEVAQPAGTSVADSESSIAEYCRLEFSTGCPTMRKYFLSIIASVRDGDMFLARYEVNYVENVSMNESIGRKELRLSCFDVKGVRQEKLCLRIFFEFMFFDEEMNFLRPANKRLQRFIPGFVLSSRDLKKPASINGIPVQHFIIVKTPESLAEKAQKLGLDTHTVLEVGCEVGTQLAELHRRLFVHCGVSPESIRVEDSAPGGKLQYAVYDCKHMCSIDEEGPRPPISTASATELLHGHAHKLKVPAHPAQDIYGFGVTLGEALSGIPICEWGEQPWTFEELYQTARDGQPMPWQGRLNPEFCRRLDQLIDPILKAVDPDPASRITAQGFVHLLQTLNLKGSLGNRADSNLNMATATTESTMNAEAHDSAAGPSPSPSAQQSSAAEPLTACKSPVGNPRTLHALPPQEDGHLIQRVPTCHLHEPALFVTPPSRLQTAAAGEVQLPHENSIERQAILRDHRAVAQAFTSHVPCAAQVYDSQMSSEDTYTHGSFIHARSPHPSSCDSPQGVTATMLSAWIPSAQECSTRPCSHPQRGSSSGLADNAEPSSQNRKPQRSVSAAYWFSSSARGLSRLIRSKDQIPPPGSVNKPL